MSLDRLHEAFKMLDALNEEMFDTSLDGINSLADAMEGDNSEDIIKITDVDAETEEDIQDSYLGKVILDCNVCHSLRFADKGTIEIDDSGIVNGEETCPYCGEASGFTVVGQIEEFENGDSQETEDDEKLDDNSSDITTDTEEKDITKGTTKNESIKRRGFRKHLCEGGKSVDFSKIKKLGKKLIKESATDVTDQIEIDTKEAGYITKKKDLEKQGYKVLHTGNGKITMAKPKELTEAPIYDLDDDEVEFLTNRKTTRIDISDREARLINKRRDLLKKYVIGFNYGAYQFVKIPTNRLERFIESCLKIAHCDGDELMQKVSTDEVNTLHGAIIYDSFNAAVEAIDILVAYNVFAEDNAFDFIIQIKDLPNDITSAAPMLTESPYYLDTKYDSRKSFYNKASVSDDTNDLYSYGVHVMTIKDGRPIIVCREDQLSQTTLRHIKEFLKQKGFPAISKQQIIKDYTAPESPLDENLRESPYKEIIIRHFEYTGSDKFFDIIADLVDRVEDFSNEEEIWEAIDSGLIYTRDQWEVYMHYCDMGDSTDKMYEGLFGDIFTICDTISNAETPTDLNESLKSFMKSKLTKRFVEGFNNINVETDDQKLTMTQDANGKVVVTTEPVVGGDSVDATLGGEAIAPVGEDTIDELIGAGEEPATEEESEEPVDEEATDEEATEEETTDEAPASEDDIEFQESFKQPVGRKVKEDLADVYRKTFDKPASWKTQQRWEDALALGPDELSDKQRKRYERKFAQQRDWERRHPDKAPTPPVLKQTPRKNEVDVEIDEFDEVSFNTLGEKYLKGVYENVASFQTTNIANNDKSLIIEGVISFASGAKKKTGFIFEADTTSGNGLVRFVGGNKHFSNSKKAFIIEGRVKDRKLVTESFSYNYRPGSSKKRIVGKISSK